MFARPLINAGGPDAAWGASLRYVNGARPEQRFALEMQCLRALGPDVLALRVIRWDEVIGRLAQLRLLLPDVELLYAPSSEGDPAILGLLKLERNVSFAPESAAELDMLKVLRIPTQRICLTGAVPSPTTVHAASRCRPRTLSAGSNSAVESLLNRGCRPAGGWSPTLQLVVKVAPGQPLISPDRVSSVLEFAQGRGFLSFGISVVPEGDLTSSEERASVVRAVSEAVRGFEQRGVQVEGIQILAELADSHSLQQHSLYPDVATYLVDLSAMITEVRETVASHSPKCRMQVEVGQLLVGHVPTFGRVLNVKRQLGHPEVFTGLGTYGNLAGHQYLDLPFEVEFLPDPNGRMSLSEECEEGVFQGVSCDSTDSGKHKHNRPEIGQSAGDLVKLPVPKNLTGGCYVLVRGRNLSKGGMDFNGIPVAQVVVYHQGKLWASPLLDSQAPKRAAASRWWGTSEPDDVKRCAEEAADAISDRIARRKESGLRGANVDDAPELAFRPERQLERFREMVGRLKQQGKLDTGTVVVFDLDFYALLLSNLELLRWKKQADGRFSGVDRNHIPIKTFCDPIALAYMQAFLNRFSNGSYGADAASAEEMRAALAAGFKLEHMIVSHPHMTPETLRMVCSEEFAPWAVTIDSREQLMRLVDGGLSRNTVIYLRFKTTGKGIKGNLSEKFGFFVGTTDQKKEALNLLRECRDRGFLKLGLAFHVGTQGYDPKNYGSALQVALELTQMAWLDRDPIKVGYYNIGGGVCDERVAGQQGTQNGPLNTRRILAGVGRVVADFRKVVEPMLGGPVYIIAEPGRASCAAASAVATQVLAAGSDDFSGRPQLCVPIPPHGALSGNFHDEAFFDFVPLRPGADTTSWLVHSMSPGKGKIFPSRRDDQTHDLPVTLAPGDVVVVPGAGAAYGWNTVGAPEVPMFVAVSQHGNGGERQWWSPHSEWDRQIAEYVEQQLKKGRPLLFPIGRGALAVSASQSM
jgi:diaminopimelate decarboxylase